MTNYKDAVDSHLKKMKKNSWDDQYRSKGKKIDFDESKITTDNVNHPPHYKKGSIECLDAIKASLSFEGFKGYLKGNVEKYIWRMDYKGKPLEDCEKAMFYLKRMIEHLKENNNNEKSKT